MIELACLAACAAAPIRQIKQGQRSTFYCVHCQK
jgi:formamidopyrimidine-DNA glycosylase